MTNQQIADVFDLLSKLMDIHGENSFKTKTYSTAAYKIEKLPEQLHEMNAAQILSIAGIGEAVSQKINVIKETGKLPLLEEYIAKTPPGVIEMLGLKGVGPKKIAQLWKELGVESIGELEYACNENRLVSLKGFGAKTQEGILKNITFLRNNLGFYLWAEAEAYAGQVLTGIRHRFPDYKIDFTGDYRRQMPAISAIEYITDLDEDQLRTWFGTIPGSVVDPDQNGLVVKVPDMPALRFLLCATADYYTAYLTSTAPPLFMDAFREKYEILPAAVSEEAIFTHNNLQFIAPALREQAAVLEAAAGNKLPELIAPADIKGIIHSHSTYSDGVHSLEQMAIAARDKGYEYLVISDHSQAAFYANGLSPERISQQHAEIDRLNERLAPFRIFKSIEADILHDGSLDYNEAVLSTFDLVIASVHSNLKMTEEKAMQRLIAAVTNPFTRILGHPTGRLLLSREGYPVDYKTLIDACAAHKVVIEINAHPRRLDLDWSWIPYALEQGVLLSIDPDAHSINGMDLVKYGVYAAQKGGLTRDRNLSSMSLAEFEQFLKNR